MPSKVCRVDVRAECFENGERGNEDQLAHAVATAKANPPGISWMSLRVSQLHFTMIQSVPIVASSNSDRNGAAHHVSCTEATLTVNS